MRSWHPKRMLNCGSQGPLLVEQDWLITVELLLEFSYDCIRGVALRNESMSSAAHIVNAYSQGPLVPLEGDVKISLRTRQTATGEETLSVSWREDLMG